MTAAVAERRIRACLERQDLTIEDLIQTTDELLPAIAPEQTRYKVRERLDVRTIRYYVTQGLLPKPFGYEGGRARYGGTHLLRLLFIKKRQAEHETLARITKELEGANDQRVLEAMLAGDRPRKKRSLPPPIEGQIAKAPASPKPVHSEPQTQRLTLAPGGTLEVPRHVLRDPALCRELAANLENLAEWLKSTAGEDE